MIYKLLYPIDWLMDQMDRWLQKKLDEKLRIKDDHHQTFIRHIIQ